MAESTIPAVPRRVADQVLVAIQQGLAGPPIYCFHPLSGSAAVYGPLALQLGRQYEVHGVQSAGLVPEQVPDTSVTDMAARYAAAIAGHTSGERMFVGYSVGGVLAVETARILSAHEGSRPGVVLIDADPVHLPNSPGGPWSVVMEQVFGIDEPSPASLAALPREDALAAVRGAAAANGKLPSRFSLERLGLMVDVCAINERAVTAHLPSPYAGTVHSIRSTARRVDAWVGFADHVVVHHVAGDHHGVLSAQALPHIADVLRPLINGSVRTGARRNGDHG